MSSVRQPRQLVGNPHADPQADQRQQVAEEERQRSKAGDEPEQLQDMGTAGKPGYPEGRLHAAFTA